MPLKGEAGAVTVEQRSEQLLRPFFGMSRIKRTAYARPLHRALPLPRALIFCNVGPADNG